MDLGPEALGHPGASRLIECCQTDSPDQAKVRGYI